MPKFIVVEEVKYLVDAADEESAVEFMIGCEDRNEYFHSVKDRYAYSAEDSVAPAVRCGNCEWEGDESQMACSLEGCADLTERLDPGSVVPAGDCPQCGAFCYLTTSLR